ncbi:response regulator transcription factor [Paenibacillus sacheonensis]|uniref:Helix-turn-helix domain-containing protein n=1 Tax=Paenibacillus sacheonensis TaxID=742054 RepID=A0A7X4YJM9_9BACL|nr:helix-turn-helix domain-containing protein [Paenibacillus sacheonensis]MBM7564022.1 two-component system response regulator YesN [Paenibacillus sacheonensis]NBC67643.1 helix-turn-helix domain-containing protein [Paenibacillus sacheonensis]
MYKVLIVDDEKLVRQGIMTTFPWQKHGFVVAGDAASGESALERIGQEPFDLLVTDLAMNGMSGLELIRRVKEMEPGLPAVVLTCHDNFKYIQEAMRLGVLDYIVKTEIEDEAVDETLERIARKLSEELGSKERANRGKPRQEGLLLFAPGPDGTPQELIPPEDQEEYDGRLTEIDGATWLLRLAVSEAGALADVIRPRLAKSGWTCVRIGGLEAADSRNTAAVLRDYRRHVLFHAAEAYAEAAWTEVAEAAAAATDRAGSIIIGANWDGPEWVYSEERFETMLRETAAAGIDGTALLKRLYPVVLEWERLLATGSLKGLLEQTNGLLRWRDWEAWLRGFRSAIRTTVDANGSRQIAENMMRAIELLDREDGPEPSESEIARAVNMSRGYFSKCFKKVTGQSYGDYVRKRKLERAKRLILRTDDPIARVAEQCGFSDYRHFSRVFRDFTGMLPNEYRKTGRT